MGVHIICQSFKSAQPFTHPIVVNSGTHPIVVNSGGLHPWELRATSALQIQANPPSAGDSICMKGGVEVGGTCSAPCE
jgi:hypothetical protein